MTASGTASRYMRPSLEEMSCTAGSCPVASLFPVYRQENGLGAGRINGRFN